MDAPPLPAEGEEILAWALRFAAWARQARVIVAPGSALYGRRSRDGQTIGLAETPYVFGMTTGTVKPRNGMTPGSGPAQPYHFNGTAFVKAGKPITVFNKSLSQIDPGYAVTWNTLDGFPFLDWSECSAG